jgi:hypothetical protein
MDEVYLQSAPVGAQHNLLHEVPRFAGEQGPTPPSVMCLLWEVPFFPLQVPFASRTFTMSLLLQQSVGLRRRLRPLCHTRACSRPQMGRGGLRVPQFQSAS